MEEIEKILQDGEKILWKRTNIRNLLKIYPIIIGIVVVSTLLIFGLIYTSIVAFSVNNLLVAYILLFLFLILESVLILSVTLISIKYRRKWIKRFQKTSEELKNYIEIDIITNKRIIKKSIIEIERLESHVKHFKNLSDFLKIIDIIDDIVFLNLDYIEEVIIMVDIKRIIFIVEDYNDDQLFYIDFFKFKNEFKKSNINKTLNAINDTINILKNIIPPEKFNKESLIQLKEHTLN
ncbi:MAG: hypothetical protein EU529_09355 [Promethearchaeota archaeon]|nr:MAG: hypothetical protein EU529_09355 [Candidatus Lokiarchaeota archaeon]